MHTSFGLTGMRFKVHEADEIVCIIEIICIYFGLQLPYLLTCTQHLMLIKTQRIQYAGGPVYSFDGQSHYFISAVVIIITSSVSFE